MNGKRDLLKSLTMGRVVVFLFSDLCTRKETYKRDLETRHAYSKRNLQKRPTKEACVR